MQIGKSKVGHDYKIYITSQCREISSDLEIGQRYNYEIDEDKVRLTPDKNGSLKLYDDKRMYLVSELREELDWNMSTYVELHTDKKGLFLKEA